RFLECPLAQTQARTQLNLPPQGTCLGFVGRLERAKGAHTAIEAFNQVVMTKSDSYLVLVTEFAPPGHPHYSYTQDIQNLINSSPRKDRIYVLPFSEKVEEIFRAFDVFIMASLAETFGMVTVEAMASGVPVIGANAGGTAEILEHGQ